MNKLKHIIWITLLVTSLSSCTTAIIDEGSIENLPPITRRVTYNSDVKDIMYNYCVTCHGGNTPSANLDLTNYNNVKQSAQNGTLIQRMNDVANPMPESGILSPNIRQIVEKWRTDGFPEN